MHRNHITQRKTADGVQFRTAAPDAFAIRADGDTPGFSGHAATFMVADSYWTAFAKGAFRKSLKDRGDRLPVLWQHWPDYPIGRHVEIKEDTDGLFVDVALVDDGAEGTTALSRLRGGVPLGLSFGFQTVKDRSAEDDDEIDVSQLPKGANKDELRIITEVRLWETSLVTFPANEAATITAVRSEIETDALSLLLDAIRTGDMSDAQYAQIVAAWQARDGAGAGTDHSTPTDAKARRRQAVDIALALAKNRGLLSGVPQ